MTTTTDHRKTVAKLVLVTVAMFGFGFAMVPLYDVLCEVTGLNGKTAGGPAEVAGAVRDDSRLVTVEFVALNVGPRWEFRPQKTRMQVHPGQSYQTTFFARNKGTSLRVAQAVPSVAPGKAAQHFKKTECFCFTRQEFLAGEGKDMPVVFILDPELPTGIDTVTLSYTFYELESQAGVGAVNDTYAAGPSKLGGEGV